MPNTVFHPRFHEKNPGLNAGNSCGTHHRALIVASTKANTSALTTFIPSVFFHRNSGNSNSAYASENANPVNR